MPATSTKCTTKPHGDDDDEEVAEEDEGSSCNSILPIDLSKCQKLLCILCTHKAIDPTCLTSSTGVAKYGSTWPWSRYTYVKDSKGIRVARKPSTKVCGPCRNTFHLLGLDADFDSPQDFLAQSSKPENAGKMRGFIGSQKLWIVGQWLPRSAGCKLPRCNAHITGRVEQDFLLHSFGTGTPDGTQVGLLPEHTAKPHREVVSCCSARQPTLATSAIRSECPSTSPRSTWLDQGG